MFCSGHAHMADGNVMLAGGNKFYPNATQRLRRPGEQLRVRRRPERVREAARHAGGPLVPDAHHARRRRHQRRRRARRHRQRRRRAGGAVRLQHQDLGRATSRSGGRSGGSTRHCTCMDDGKLFYSGTNTFGNALPGSATWDLETDTVQDLPLSQPDLRDQSASVLLPPAQDQKVMVLGGGNSYSGQMATASTYIHDLAAGTHVEGPPLPTNKMYVNAAILPDRTVFETGGAEAINTNPKHETSIYDPETNSVHPGAGHPRHRPALPLVRAAAAGRPGGGVRLQPGRGHVRDADLGLLPRLPVQGPAADDRRRARRDGQRRRRTTSTVTVPSGAGVRDVSLIRAGSVTHQFDPNLRLVDVPFTADRRMASAWTSPTTPTCCPRAPTCWSSPTRTGCRPWPAGSRCRPSRRRRARATAARPYHAAHTAASRRLRRSVPAAVPAAVLLRGAGATTRQAARPSRGGRRTTRGCGPARSTTARTAGRRFTPTTIGDGCDHNYRGGAAAVCVPTLAGGRPTWASPSTRR